jgi:hypothetical protein
MYWSEAYELVPSLEVGYVWHASKFTREVLDGLLRIGFEQIDKSSPAGLSFLWADTHVCSPVSVNLRKPSHLAHPASMKRIAPPKEKL